MEMKRKSEASPARVTGSDSIFGFIYSMQSVVLIKNKHGLVLTVGEVVFTDLKRNILI